MALPKLRRLSEGRSIDHTPSSAVTAGDVVLLPDGRVGVSPADIAANKKGAVEVFGLFEVTAASGTTWNDGADLYYDASAGEVVAKTAALEGANDLYLGRAIGAKVSGTTKGTVDLNVPRRPGGLARYYAAEFDCEDGQDETASVKNKHVLIPAEENPNGLLILGIYGLVTEQFAGDTEDQGVVTVSDESDNALGTVTAADAGADAIGDILRGTNAAIDAASGTAVKTVAAGEFVDAQVTQETSGASKAGKMKVYVLAVPLV